jgi:hypothetical protein
MQNDWILDVLADLKNFAAANDLAALAEQLDDTLIVAASVIASKDEELRVGSNGEKGRSGSDIEEAGSHRTA